MGRRRKKQSISEFLVSLLGFGLMLEVAVWIFENVLNDSSMGTETEIYVPWLHYSIGIVFLLLVLRVWFVLGTRRKTSSISSSKAKRVQEKTQRYTSQSLRVRPDDDLLRSSFQALNGAEFERLLALYFRDQGFTVKRRQSRPNVMQYIILYLCRQFGSW